MPDRRPARELVTLLIAKTVCRITQHPHGYSVYIA